MLEDLAQIATDAARRLHRAGNITDLELARHLTRVEQARLERLRAEAERDLALEELTALLGLEDPEKFTLAPELPDLPGVEPEGSELEARGLAERLDLAVARLEEKALVERLGAARVTAIQPELGLGVEAERETDGSWLVGPSLQAAIPLFDTGRAAVAAETGRLRRARARVASLEVRVRSETRLAYRQLLTARSEAEHYRRVLLPLNGRVVNESQLQYNAMALGIFELLQAKQEQLETGEEYARSLQDYWLARVRLARAVGGRLPEPVPPEPEEVNDLEELFIIEEKPEPMPDAPPRHDHRH